MNKQQNDEQNDPFGPFNLSHFKRWMGNQHDSKSEPNLIGLHVESKIPLKKLIDRMEAQDEDDIEEMAKEFKKDGGVINDVDGRNVMIEVNSGSFTIHRMYIKKD